MLAFVSSIGNKVWHKVCIFYRKYMHQLVTGYLPSVILMLFLYTVPPMMMLFAAIEGSTSRSGRKKSACHKVLVFMIWNVFFVNVLSGSVITQLNVLNNPTKIPTLLGKAVPAQVSFLIISPNLIHLILLTHNFFYPFMRFCRPAFSLHTSWHQVGRVYHPS